MSSPPTIYQPLHPAIRDQLDPEYVAFHDAVLQFVPRSETITFDPVTSRAAKSPLAHGGQKLVKVGKIEDRTIYTGSSGKPNDEVAVRIFTPEGDAPADGWPCLVWYHGGGWVMGGLGSENGFLTHVCRYTSCVVISINYRHAPEHVYPAAADDAFLGYKWVVAPERVAELKLDLQKTALGGLSAGGGLAAITGLKIAECMSSSTDSTSTLTKPIFQVLICPVIDNTVTIDTDPAERAGWQVSQNSPWLTPTRMQWYRDQYFKGTASTATAEWTASPCYAPSELLAASPPTFLGIAGSDLLAPEAQAYGAQLAKAGVPIDVQTYAGGTHSVLVLAGIHQLGKKLVHDACTALASALGTAYDPAIAPVLSQAE
ncbi:hypothetical protein Sste5346_001840 [Sporothrix stenoceras]|uniref:Alpha/beta hydrolase fold-3 domain-containing protein n=1 Tax=Sporothrix stenoceras TaxID=5173 RepID=A0ABR3ZL67_9PEZI